MKTLPTQLEEQVNEIASWMFPAGSQNRIAKKAKVTTGFVSMVLNKKKYPTPEFMRAAEEVMNENKVMFNVQPIMKAS